MVWHGINSEQCAFLLLAYTVDVCVEISLVFFGNCPLAVFCAPDDMVCQTDVAHRIIRVDVYFLLIYKRADVFFYRGTANIPSVSGYKDKSPTVVLLH